MDSWVVLVMIAIHANDTLLVAQSDFRSGKLVAIATEAVKDPYAFYVVKSDTSELPSNIPTFQKEDFNVFRLCTWPN